MTPRVAIVTRNAMHGGVETMIALHQRFFDATVFAAGGYEMPDTCPFPYVYVGGPDIAQAQARLTGLLAAFDVIVYHWPLWWALEAIRACGKPSLEVVHRTDTNDCDKRVPTIVVAHSHFLAEAIVRDGGPQPLVIPYGIDVDRLPEATGGTFVGAITSYYYPVKGLDLFFAAWQRLQARYPGQKVRFYGAGQDLPVYENMVRDLGLTDVELLGPVTPPDPHFPEFRLFVAPSRIEGMPFALIEALACNLPAICSDLPGMVEFNRLARERGEPEPLVLFRSEDVDDFTAKLAAELDRREPRPPTRDYIRRHYGALPHCRAYAVAIGRALERHGGRHASTLAEALRVRVAEREQALATAEHALDERNHTIAALSGELDAIKHSRGWAWVQRCRRWKARLTGARTERPT